MIKERKMIIKKAVDEKTCISCIHQNCGVCDLLNFKVGPYIHNSCCMAYTHYNELKEVK